MVGVVIATHGDFSKGLLNAVELIAGKQPQVETIGLHHGDGIGEFDQKVREAVESVDTGDGVIVFVDIMNGTPANTVMRLIPEKDNLRAISGVNMPMAVTAIMSREDEDLDDLTEECLEAGKETISLMNDTVKEMMAAAAAEDEEDDF